MTLPLANTDLSFLICEVGLTCRVCAVTRRAACRQRERKTHLVDVKTAAFSADAWGPWRHSLVERIEGALW